MGSQPENKDTTPYYRFPSPELKGTIVPLYFMYALNSLDLSEDTISDHKTKAQA